MPLVCSSDLNINVFPITKYFIYFEINLLGKTGSPFLPFEGSYGEGDGYWTTSILVWSALATANDQ